MDNSNPGIYTHRFYMSCTQRGHAEKLLLKSKQILFLDNFFYQCIILMTYYETFYLQSAEKYLFFHSIFTCYFQNGIYKKTCNLKYNFCINEYSTQISNIHFFGLKCFNKIHFQTNLVSKLTKLGQRLFKVNGKW